MKNLEPLSENEMQGISGGQVETCLDFLDVLEWLEQNNPAQAQIIEDAYSDQYCSM